MVTLVRDRSGREVAPDAPAPAAGTKNPELPPPPGKDYAAKKAAEDARHAPVEVDRLLGELGRKFGTAFGEAEAGLNRLKTSPLPGMTSVFEHLSRTVDSSGRPRVDTAINDAYQAKLAATLNAFPELPTYADPTLAAIAQKAFERGFGAGLSEAKARGAALDLAMNAVAGSIPAAALAIEQAGAAALRAALTRFRGMPIFLPTAVGGGGGFLRVPKPGCKLSGAGASAGGVSAEAQALATEGAELQPYRTGGGHHVPAKKAFEGAPGYDLNKALAIPKSELARFKALHQDVTGAQMQGYKAFARTGGKLTWEAMVKIETDALIKAGMPPNVASATVKKAIDALQSSGVQGPTRIPWGP